MYLMTLFSSIYFLISPLIANPSIELIRKEHLETTEERGTFLADQLTPFLRAAEQLNQEIQALSLQIQTLSPEEDQQQITALQETLSEKMARLQTMLPAINLSMNIDEDFQSLNAILKKKDPLSQEDREIADRIASIYRSVAGFQKE